MGYCCRGGTAVGNTAEEDTGLVATVSEHVAEEIERIGKGDGNARRDRLKDEEKDFENENLVGVVVVE